MIGMCQKQFAKRLDCLVQYLAVVLFKSLGQVRTKEADIERAS